jgi:hypothetical protein
MNLKNHSRITQWGVWYNFWFLPNIGIGLKLKERLVEACLQVRKVMDKIIYVQGECRWKEVYWIYIFHAGSCFQIQRGKTLLYFKLPSGTMTLLSAHNLPRCGLDSPLMRAQIFFSDNEMKLKQLVPICFAIFKLLLCGGWCSPKKLC